MTRALAAAVLASAVLVAGYVALGGGEHEVTPPPDPCGLQVPAEGEGVGATVERLGLNALAGSACELGVSREQLLLSLAGEQELEVGEERRADAFREGLRRAIDEEARTGRLDPAQAFLLRQAVGVLPIDAVLERLFGR